MVSKKMLKQAQQLQKDMMRMQEELEGAEVESSAGGRQHDPRTLGQTLLPRGATNHTFQDLLLSSAELDCRGDSHIFDVLLAIVRGGRRGKRIGQPWGDLSPQR